MNYLAAEMMAGEQLLEDQATRGPTDNIVAPIPGSVQQDDDFAIDLDAMAAKAEYDAITKAHQRQNNALVPINAVALSGGNVSELGQKRKLDTVNDSEIVIDDVGATMSHSVGLENDQLATENRRKVVRNDDEIDI